MQLKRNLLSVALASATLMLAANAQAQDTSTTDQAQAATAADQEATELDAVVVTGIRRGIEDSIDTKQAEDTIVEAISAEDIGKLPDTSIADSLARLPGLTAQRFGGRPQEINIRGFAGDFSTTLLNGREQVSLGNNRGVEFDQYPSELMSQVVVHKTTDASLVGQGLSGTVNLKTVRPLAFGDRAVALNVRGDMNRLEDEDEFGNRFSISYIDQFADNTVGIALGYARLNNPGQGHQFESWGYNATDRPGTANLFNGGKVYDIENDNVRDGLMATLEWKPNDIYHSVLDVFYSKFDKEETKRGMEFGTQAASWSTVNLVSRTDGPDGNATAATFSGVRPIIRNDFGATKDDLFSIGWNHELQLSEHWKMTADINHSSANREERILETYATLPFDPTGTYDTLSIAFNPDGYFDFDFGLDYDDPANLVLTDPGGWGGDRAQAGYLKDFDVKDALTSVRMDFERAFDAGMLSSLEFGVNLTDRTKSRSSSENTLCLTTGCTSAENIEVAIPAEFIGNSDLDFAGVTGILGLDAVDMLNNFYILRSKDHPDISNKNWEVNEKVTTAYVQLNIDADLGSIPVRGNVGVQAVNAEQSSTGVATFEGFALGESARYGTNYTHYLPSLNLSFQLPAEMFLRVGAGRQMARPRMDDLRANANYSFNRQEFEFEGSGGNPTLEPWLANAYDLSLEKYFGGNKGYVSAAYFYKDLKTYIYNQTVPFDFSQLPIPGGIPAGIPTIGEFNQPINGEGGVIKGHELAVSVPFDLLWAPLEGFGLIANYSDTQSEIQPFGPGTTEPLPGLSKYVSNATLYFERWGFSARVSQRHRSAFLGEVQGFGGDRTRRVFDGETVTDFQMGYTFQSGPLQDLSLLLQVNNVENEPFTSTFGSDAQPREYFEYGRTYLFGVNYRF